MRNNQHIYLSGLPVLFCSLPVSIYHFSIFRRISFTLCSVTLNSHICFNLSFVAKYMQGSVEIILLWFSNPFLGWLKSTYEEFNEKKTHPHSWELYSLSVMLFIAFTWIIAWLDIQPLAHIFFFCEFFYCILTLTVAVEKSEASPWLILLPWITCSFSFSKVFFFIFLSQ